MAPVLLNPSRFGGGGGGSSAYAAAVLADSPLFYGRMGDTSGTVMTDSSGNARNGVYANGVTLGTAGLITGDTDKAITLDGVNDCCTIADAAWMDAAAFTVEAVIKPSSLSGARCIIGRDGSGARGWNLYIIGGKLYVDNGAAPNIQGTSTLSAGTKYHVAMTYSASTVSFFLGGSSNGSGTFSLTTTLANGIMIGASQAGSPGGPFNLFTGIMDEVAYFGSALSGTRIAAHAALV